MQYDVSRAIITVSIFFAVFNAGKTCVYAFLTVFLRHLGLSPFQAGLLRCLQTLIGGFAAPSVLYCSGLCIQRRFTMIVCIFLTMGTYFILLIASLPSNTCFTHIPPVCDAFAHHTLPRLTNLSEQALVLTTSSQSPSTKHSNSTTPMTVYSSSILPTSIATAIPSLNTLVEESEETNSEVLSTPDAIYEQYDEPKFLLPDRNRHKNIPAQPLLYNGNEWGHKLFRPRYPERTARHKRNTPNESIFDHLPSMGALKQARYVDQGLWPSPSNIGCIILLAIVLIIGEMVSTPIDKMASSSWFSYLDEIDYTESHRRHLSYVPITTCFVVFTIGLLNVYYCYMTDGVPLSSYHLHFYIFGSLFGITLVTVSFFPLPYRKSNLRNTRVSQLINLTDFASILRYFCDTTGSFLLVVTVIINGVLYGCVHDFVPWYIEDMGGSQFAVSCAVALAFFSDMIGKFIVLNLRRRLSTNGLVILGVVTYGMRFAFFTVLYTSWGIVFTQLIHCFNSVFFWKGIVTQVRRSYDDKKEQQILLVLNSLHYVVGFSIGTVLSGALYNTYNPLILFWAMSALSFVLGIILFACFFTCATRVGKRPLSLDNGTEGEQVSLFSVDSNDEETEG